MLLYVGPDQLIPLSGFLGTAAGLAMIFWGRVIEGMRKIQAMLSSNTEAKK